MSKPLLQLELKHSLLHIVQLCLYTIAADILIAECVFVFERALSWYILPFSFLIGIIFLMIFYGEEPGKRMIFEIIIIIALFIFLAGLCGKIYDTSYDGNAYHKVAVGLLKNHWNPIKQPAGDMLVKILREDRCAIWVECYAKGAWILAAGVYGMTGNIECGKVYTFLSMLCAFCLTCYCMRRKKKGILFSVAFSLIVALNPVALAQMTTFYVDGYLHSMLYILVLTLIMLSGMGEKRKERIAFASLLACAMVICGTIKFTGLLYGGIYCIAYFLYYSYQQVRIGNGQGRSNIWKCFCWFVLLAAVTVFWAGADTYVMNTLRHGSPVYPLYGEGAIDIMTANSPFGKVNHIKNFLISIFSKMENVIFANGGVPELKIPFVVDWEREFGALGVPDMRISGFGIFFSGIFLVAGCAILIQLFNAHMRRKQVGNALKIHFLLLLVAVNMCLCLVIAESWWARYAPYIYFTALIGIFFFLDSSHQGRSKKPWIALKTIFCAVLLANSLIFTMRLPDAWRYSRLIHNKISALSAYHNVEVETQRYLGIYFNFEDLRVHYTPTVNLTPNGMGTAFPFKDIQIYVK